MKGVSSAEGLRTGEESFLRPANPSPTLTRAQFKPFDDPPRKLAHTKPVGGCLAWTGNPVLLRHGAGVAGVAGVASGEEDALHYSM